MTTNPKAPGAMRALHLEQAAVLKALIGATSLAATLIGWGWLSANWLAKDVEQSAAQPVPTASLSPTVVLSEKVVAAPVAELEPLPTLVALSIPVSMRTSADAVSPPPVSEPAPQPVSQPAPQLRRVDALPPLPVAAAPVAVTRSSR